VLFAGAVERGFGEILEQGVRLAIEHAVSLLDGGLAGGPLKPAFGLSGDVRTSQTRPDGQAKLSSCHGD
jgi:hypothetical protein